MSVVWSTRQQEQLVRSQSGSSMESVDDFTSTTSSLAKLFTDRLQTTWNFDFRIRRPLNGDGRYEWTPEEVGDEHFTKPTNSSEVKMRSPRQRRLFRDRHIRRTPKIKCTTTTKVDHQQWWVNPRMLHQQQHHCDKVTQSIKPKPTSARRKLVFDEIDSNRTAFPQATVNLGSVITMTAPKIDAVRCSSPDESSQSRDSSTTALQLSTAFSSGRQMACDLKTDVTLEQPMETTSRSRSVDMEATTTVGRCSSDGLAGRQRHCSASPTLTKATLPCRLSVTSSRYRHGDASVEGGRRTVIKRTFSTISSSTDNKITDFFAVTKKTSSSRV